MRTKHLFKTLIVSMLAIGAMAIGASAAQAAWNLSEIETAKASLSFTGTANAMEKLIPGLLSVSCTGGTVSATVTDEGTGLTGKGSTSLTGCIVKDSMGKVNSNCSINSPGSGAGTITAKGEGSATMPNATDVLFTLKSASFTEVEINGALCPLDEHDDTLNGGLSLLILNGMTLAKLHKVHLDENGLLYGENKAELHSTEGTAVLGSMELASGNSYRFVLTGL